ncbi:MAG: helix-turn-helix domain-containing protein [Bacteroidota bacterium]
MSDLIVSMTKADLEATIANCVKNTLTELNHQPTTAVVEEQPTDNSDVFLTKAESANFLKCSPSTIDNYARAGKLTRHYRGRNVLFPKNELRALIKSGK